MFGHSNNFKKFPDTDDRLDSRIPEISIQIKQSSSPLFFVFNVLLNVCVFQINFL